MGAIAVLAARAGYGSGDVALGLAAALARTGQTACLVEPERRSDLTALFGEDPARDLMDLLADRPACLDLRVTRPRALPRLAWVTGAAAADLAGRLRGRFQHVVISAGCALPAGADRALVVTPATPGALAETGRLLDRWPARGAPPARVVLTGYYPDLAARGLVPGWTAVQEMLGCPLAAVVPQAPEAPEPGARFPDRRSPAGRAYRHLAQRLLGQQVPLERDVGAPSGLLERLLGR